MHVDGIGERVLAEFSGETSAPNGGTEFSLQGHRVHVATVRSRHFYGYALTCSLYIWVTGRDAMGLRIVYDEMNLSLDLPSGSDIAERIGVQIERCLVPSETSMFARRLVDEITRVLDADLLPPSQLEVTIATLTAKALDIPLPGEALRYRGSMIEFLDRYQPLLGTRRNGWSHTRRRSKQRG